MRLGEKAKEHSRGRKKSKFLDEINGRKTGQAWVFRGLPHSLAEKKKGREASKEVGTDVWKGRVTWKGIGGG